MENSRSMMAYPLSTRAPCYPPLPPLLHPCGAVSSPALVGRQRHIEGERGVIIEPQEGMVVTVSEG